jgi:glycosyltransferase involved in cell wall biosynthesis
LRVHGPGIAYNAGAFRFLASGPAPSLSAHTAATTPNRSARPRLSVIVITKNEVARLGRCLASVPFADEWVVVDSGSTDGSQALARGMGARVIVTDDWPGFGPQKNRALAEARGDWVLSLDADEWLSAELAQQIQAVVEAPAGEGAVGAACPVYALSRLSSFCGQWMRHGGWYPDRVPRLFRRGQARFSNDLVHERLVFEPSGASVSRVLEGHLLHESMPTLSSAIDKMDRYSSGRAADLAARGRKGGLGRALGHGFWAFVRTYVLRRGFLDGRLGLVLALHNAESSYYRYLKIWLEHGAPARPGSP